MATETIRVQKWNSRKKEFVPCLEDVAALEAWRNTPGRIHVAEPMRATHDTSGLDYDRPVQTVVKTFKIGTPLEQGVVADKRIIAGRAEYLLKPHTRASQKQWDDTVRRKRIAEIKRLLEPSYDDYRERKDAPQLREELARLSAELGI
jgi:hypothetical protein